MGRVAGAGDNNFDPALTGRGCPFGCPLRAAMGRGNRYFKSNAKFL
jgi:hypothetical protein